MLRICWVFIFIGLQIGCLHAQSEAQLRKQMQQTRDKTEVLMLKLHLLDLIYERDRAAWYIEVQQCLHDTTIFPTKQAQQIRELLRARSANYLGNHEAVKELFLKNLQHVHFKDPELEFYRLQLGNLAAPDQVANRASTWIQFTRHYLKNRELSAVYQQLAMNYVARQQKDSAIWASNLATQLAKRSDKKWVLIEALQRQAEVYWQLNMLEQAVQHSIYAVQMADEAKLNYYKISPYLLIASISTEVRNYNQALSYLKQAKKTFDQSADPRNRAFLNYLFAKYYTATNQEAKAHAAAMLAIGWFKYAGNQSYVAKSTLVSIENKLNTQGKVIFPALQSQVTDSYFLAEYAFVLGRNYMILGQLVKAEQAFIRALQLLPDASYLRPKIADSYRYLAQIARQKGNFEMALSYQQLLTAWLENSPVWRSAAKIEEMTAANLREARERLIENQRLSILKAQKQREIIELQRDRQLFLSILVIVAIVFAGIVYFLRVQQIRMRQDQREAELSQTLLRTQMNPHFVFNAMSVIQSYIYENNPEKSSQFLVNFSRLMRLILENSPKEFIPIELEREILDKYLSAQKMRFENRFDYELSVSDELLFNKAMVSPMITQPFIENAIEHGQLHTVKGGKIWVDMKEENGQLVISIQDNGVGRKKSASTKKIRTHKSMAIDITKERIAILNKKYKFNGSLTMTDLDLNKETGTIVTLVLPLKYETAL
ncbi:MAG: hypothetical protein RLZZ301_1151 [Bacteroidota bacterium]